MPEVTSSHEQESVSRRLKDQLDNVRAIQDELGRSSAGLNVERVEQGMSPFLPPGLSSTEGMIRAGSGQHIRENLGNRGLLGLLASVGLPLLGDVEQGRSVEQMGGTAARGLGEYVGAAMDSDMLRTASRAGNLTGAGSTAAALNAAAKLLGAPGELTEAVDMATTPLNPLATTLKEGAGSWYSLLQSGAQALSGERNWERPLMEHMEQGITTASPFQPLYWAGEALSGGGERLINRLIGEEGASGGMGTLVQAGNYWGDVMSGTRSLGRDLGEIGSYMWEGASGRGGVRSVLNAGREALSGAGSYWGDILSGRGNLGRDLSEIGGFLRQNVTGEKILGGLQSAGEAITRTVGGEKLVGLTRQAGDYWGDMMSGQGNLGRDLSEIGSYLWRGASGRGGIRGAASSALDWTKSTASQAASAVRGTASRAWNWVSGLF